MAILFTPQEVRPTRIISSDSCSDHSVRRHTLARFQNQLAIAQRSCRPPARFYGKSERRSPRLLPYPVDRCSTSKNIDPASECGVSCPQRNPRHLSNQPSSHNRICIIPVSTATSGTATSRPLYRTCAEIPPSFHIARNNARPNKVLAFIRNRESIEVAPAPTFQMIKPPTKRRKCFVLKHGLSVAVPQSVHPCSRFREVRTSRLIPL